MTVRLRAQDYVGDCCAFRLEAGDRVLDQSGATLFAATVSIKAGFVWSGATWDYAGCCPPEQVFWSWF